MKLKQLESALQSVEVFSKPSVKLEQYPTSPHIAGILLFLTLLSYCNLLSLKHICYIQFKIVSKK
jgi:predicted RNA methylase